uniref:Uncharacterized protein n=1 Tax=Timema cristinae TaxID=61476 RepID=A0A7R9H4K6_TIMCR|nr:unnamed protein product [Timema cristinae]
MATAVQMLGYLDARCPSRRLSAIAIISLPSYPWSYIAVDAKHAGMEEREGWRVTLHEILEGQLRLVDWLRAAFSLSGNSGQWAASGGYECAGVHGEDTIPSQDTGPHLTCSVYRVREITTSTEMSTEASTLPVAPQSVNAEFTVYLSGLTPVVVSTPKEGKENTFFFFFYFILAPVITQYKSSGSQLTGSPAMESQKLKSLLFAQNITEFKTAVKGMAVSFCTVNNINIIDNITEKNVIISYAVQCPITWPNSDKCVQVTMSIPIIVLNDTAYEMTTIHLYQMWNQYSARDALLQELGLKVYSVPRTEVTMYTWMGVSLGCLAIFAIILVMVWRLDIFTNHSDRLSGVSESQPKMSTTSQKSWIELPYQEFPPMGVDDFPEYEPDNLHTGKGAHINLHPLPSPTPKLPRYGPPQEYGAALHFFPTSFDNQALIEKDDDIYQKRDRNTSTS